LTGIALSGEEGAELGHN